MPLATNMCVVAFEHLPPACGRTPSRSCSPTTTTGAACAGRRRLAAICETFGLGLSMHSNSHLGISLAAMTHLAAATPNLDYACDTHWPWKDPEEDVIVPGVLRFVDGAVAVPTTPGLGVELDRDALARLHEQYLTCGLRQRDDTGYMQTVDPSYVVRSPRW